MTLPIYQVDAFAEKLFAGNPAAVIPLNDAWLPDELMQSIATENNLSETVFFIHKDNKYHIRWFTPYYEVDLCGHATVAAAFVLKQKLGYQAEHLSFESKSGTLGVIFDEDWISLDFPSMDLSPYKNEEISVYLGQKPLKQFRAKDDIFIVFENESQIANLNPNFDKLKEIEARGIICTAKSSQAEIDFVSRFFAPRYGINEDPVTGSAHTKLIPFWSKELGKTKLTALQISKRGGFLRCEHLENRVKIAGKAKLYMIGEIFIS
ncbi:phenazine biosynthesis protein PhzF family [Spirosomataceae bacterium TFI 002]|nr:phenazine biosynthesis protein PhzF family [Spirosomataceae bacterium TFI 002]